MKTTLYALANIEANGTMRDLTTGLEISHEEKYTRIVNALGYEKVKRCIPFTLKEIKKALPKDEHLNNLPIKKWDNASGIYIPYGQTSSSAIQFIETPFSKVYRDAGVTSYSQSDGVCILKQCARMWAEEGNKMERLSEMGFHAAHRKYTDYEMYNELCKYQDTGLTPEQIHKLVEDYNTTQSCPTCEQLQVENEQFKIELNNYDMRSVDWYRLLVKEGTAEDGQRIAVLVYEQNKQLKAENEQLKAQLDKAVEDMTEIATSGYGTAIRARYCINKSKRCTNSYNLCHESLTDCKGFSYRGLEDNNGKKAEA